jgi:hypothetical protein
MLAHRIPAERIPQLTGAEVLNAKKVAVIRHIGIKKTMLVSTPMSRAIEDAKPVEATKPAQ